MRRPPQIKTQTNTITNSIDPVCKEVAPLQLWLCLVWCQRQVLAQVLGDLPLEVLAALVRNVSTPLSPDTWDPEARARRRWLQVYNQTQASTRLLCRRPSGSPALFHTSPC